MARQVSMQFGKLGGASSNSQGMQILEESGTIAGDINSGSYKDYTVTFASAFPSAPWVSIEEISSSTAYQYGSHAITFTSAPTESGFTIRFFNNTGARRYPTIRWHAMLVTSGGGSSGSDIPEYTGSYNVTPTTSSQTLATANKKMTGDLNVQEIPADFGQVSPPSTKARRQ